MINASLFSKDLNIQYADSVLMTGEISSIQNVQRQTGQGHFDDNHVSVADGFCREANLKHKKIWYTVR